ncbi:MAG: 1-acyl-sn-glycerol-3-phosphate acyltransferase [Candidatus Marinimicrobia bacterium]|nr:1-acyl-sn-glycerol-3-phosphate acyltransferase [Candidatus Neomarinimicrobiota bacterium]
MRTIWIIINLIVWTIILGGGGAVLSIFSRKGTHVMHWVAVTWSKIILWSGNIQYSISGLEKISHHQPYFFTGNHSSGFDIPLAYATIPNKMVSIAKIELKKIPIFSQALSAGGHIFVDRSQHDKAIESLEKAKKSLKSDPRSILLFPEGTRSVDGEIKPFKRGGIVMAIQMGIPIVPVAFCGTYQLLTKGKWNIKETSIEAVLGSPIATENLDVKDRRIIASQIRDEVIQLKNDWEKKHF